jgi:hypothetical protein
MAKIAFAVQRECRSTKTGFCFLTLIEYFRCFVCVYLQDQRTKNTSADIHQAQDRWAFSLFYTQLILWLTLQVGIKCAS